jgi:hypothetical protein
MDAQEKPMKYSAYFNDNEATTNEYGFKNNQRK